VVAHAAAGTVVVLAHDMGTSVTTELLARDLCGRLPFDLQRAVLSNGSVILERASLRPFTPRPRCSSNSFIGGQLAQGSTAIQRFSTAGDCSKWLTRKGRRPRLRPYDCQIDA
jgi:hypothetical protein